MGKGKRGLKYTFPHTVFFLPPPGFHGNGNIIIGERSFMCKQQQLDLSRHTEKLTLWPFCYLCVASPHFKYTLIRSTLHVKRDSVHFYKVSLALPIFQNENSLRLTLIVRYISTLGVLSIQYAGCFYFLLMSFPPTLKK